MAPAIKAKVHSLPGVEHLYAAITKDQLEIPAYITEYDMAVSCSICITGSVETHELFYRSFHRQMAYITSNL